MTINIQNASNVNVNGHHNHKNCKAVYCIDTGEMYASAIDAAKAEGVARASMSYALTGRSKTCNGKRFCFVSKVMEHLEEIAEMNRIRAEKVAAYDADVERRNAIAKAQNNVERYEAQVIELERNLELTKMYLEDAKRELHALKHGD